MAVPNRKQINVKCVISSYKTMDLLSLISFMLFYILWTVLAMAEEEFFIQEMIEKE